MARDPAECWYCSGPIPPEREGFLFCSQTCEDDDYADACEEADQAELDDEDEDEPEDDEPHNHAGGTWRNCSRCRDEEGDMRYDMLKEDAGR